MGNQNISPVEERLVSPSPPRLSTEYAVNSIVANQYRIEDKIGDGGMGTVYKCTDLVVRRTVAVKFLHPHLVNTSKWLLRFQQEATAIGRLHHPNVIRIHQFCAEADPPFIVMDFVEGKSLSEVLSAEGTISLKRCINIMRQVADALSHAHDMGVVHRDLKPSNVIVLKNDVVQILDFGIAKLDDDTGAQSAIKLTQTGEVFGSPAYMSPEQCLGKRVNAQSDQYSFGCMIYECLTGSPPFVGISPVEVMMKHVSDPPASLKEASLGKQFPAELELLVQKLLAKQPQDRFGTMNEAMTSLSEIGETGPKSEKVSTTKKSEKSKPISLKNIGLAALVIAVAISLPLVIIKLSDAPSEKSTYDQVHSVVAPKSTVTEEEQLTAAANEGLRQELRGQVQKNPKLLRFGPPRQTGISGDALRAFPELCPQIQYLNFNSCELGDSGLEHLINLKYLASLLLSDTKITNSGLKTIAQIPSLQELHLAGTNITDDGLKDVVQLPLLYCVSVARASNITPNGVKLLASTRRMKDLYLDDLDMTGCGQELAQNPLHELILDGCTFDDSDLEQLSHLKTINSLSLSRTDLSGTCVNSLMKMKSLKKLKLAHCKNLGTENFLKITHALPGCTVDDK